MEELRARLRELLAVVKPIGWAVLGLGVGAAVLAHGPAETPGANIDALLRRFGGEATDAATLLAAVAAAWALGISPELIAAGLDTFVPDLHLA